MPACWKYSPRWVARRPQTLTAAAGKLLPVADTPTTGLHIHAGTAAGSSLVLEVEQRNTYMGAKPRLSNRRVLMKALDIARLNRATGRDHRCRHCKARAAADRAIQSHTQHPGHTHRKLTLTPLAATPLLSHNTPGSHAQQHTPCTTQLFQQQCTVKLLTQAPATTQITQTPGFQLPREVTTGRKRHHGCSLSWSCTMQRIAATAATALLPQPPPAAAIAAKLKRGCAPKALMGSDHGALGTAAASYPAR